jgi:deazaflavin-dependent oxidoreductase (nitroreductase family)
LAKTYQVTSTVRFVNRIVQMLLRLGIGSKGMYLLTVRGRKSGKLHSNPVTLIEEGGQRWLVAPYGEVNWVHNARAAGQAILTRGRQSETVDVVELGPAESAPVLKRYVNGVPITRPYFDAGPDSPLEAFKAEAARHPVFVIRAKSS